MDSIRLRKPALIAKFDSENGSKAIVYTSLVENLPLKNELPDGKIKVKSVTI